MTNPHDEDFISLNDGALGSMQCGCDEGRDHTHILRED